MKEFINDLTDDARDKEGDEAALYLRKIAAYHQANKRRMLLDDCKSELVTSISEFDTLSGRFNVQNGTLVFRGNRVRLAKHRPEDMITKLSPCKYDPKAKSEVWERFVGDTFEGSEEVADFVRKSLGRNLAGNTADERFYVCLGETRTGKSTLLETVREVFGDYAVSVDAATFSLYGARRAGNQSSPDLAALRGARLAICPELPEGMRLNSAFVKQCTGGDTITARHNYGEQFCYKPRFGLWLNTNYLPEIDDVTVFDSERCAVVPFENRRPIDKRDPGLKGFLQGPEELSGVLTWLVKGWESATAGRVRLPPACSSRTKQYASDSNVLAQFVAEECETGAERMEAGTLLFSRYRTWCERSGVQAGSKKTFYSKLRKLPGVCYSERATIRGTQKRGVFRGIQLSGV